MKKLVWVFGLLLALSFVFPNGLPIRGPENTPVAPAGPTDAKIVEILSAATPEERGRVHDVYTGLGAVLKRDDGAKMPQRITSTEKWAELQEHTLNLAIDTPGKYPGLDQAIEAVFLAAVGTDDVVSATPDVRAKLIDACEKIANSAVIAK